MTGQGDTTGVTKEGVALRDTGDEVTKSMDMVTPGRTMGHSGDNRQEGDTGG